MVPSRRSRIILLAAIVATSVFFIFFSDSRSAAIAAATGGTPPNAAGAGAGAGAGSGAAVPGDSNPVDNDPDSSLPVVGIDNTKTNNNSPGSPVGGAGAAADKAGAGGAAGAVKDQQFEIPPAVPVDSKNTVKQPTSGSVSYFIYIFDTLTPNLDRIFN